MNHPENMSNEWEPCGDVYVNGDFKSVHKVPSGKYAGCFQLPHDEETVSITIRIDAEDAMKAVDKAYQKALIEELDKEHPPLTRQLLIAELFVSYGWSYQATSLYDEEGIDGFLWESPGGYEMGVVGDLNEPPDICESMEEWLAGKGVVLN